jgi:hypothetical protein
MHDEYRPAWHACLQLATLPSDYFQGEEGIPVDEDPSDPDAEKADALGHALSVCPAEKVWSNCFHHIPFESSEFDFC